MNKSKTNPVARFFDRAAYALTPQEGIAFGLGLFMGGITTVSTPVGKVITTLALVLVFGWAIVYWLEEVKQS